MNSLKGIGSSSERFFISSCLINIWSFRNKGNKVEEEEKIEEKVEELKEAVEVEPTVEDVFKKTKRKK